MTKHTHGPWRIAERARWNAEVRFIRTAYDDSGIVGVTNDNDAPLIVSSPKLLAALVRIVNDVPAPGEDAQLTVGGYNHACKVIEEATGGQSDLPDIYEELANVTAALNTVMAHYGPSMPQADRDSRERLLQRANKALTYYGTSNPGD